MSLLKSISKKQIAFLYAIIHVLTWNMVFLIPFVLFDKPLKEVISLPNVLLVSKAVIIFYLNYFILVPKLLFNKKIGAFLLGIIFIISVSIWININEEHKFGKPHREEMRNFGPPPGDFNPREKNATRPDQSMPPPLPFNKIRIITQLSFTLVLIGVSTSLKLAEGYFTNQKAQEQIRSEKLNTELSFLKAQINPHFLFNSLNSIYSLAYSKSDKAPESIIQLSKIMRYVFDEANNNKVPLNKELEHLADYIELQKLRLTPKTKVSYIHQAKGNSPDIEPMLLVPFIENAFKHGVDSVNDSVIDIKIDVDNNILNLQCSNTIARTKTETHEAESGIGFNNVKRRLELLYPNAYKLKVIDDNNQYSVSLKLTLHA